MVGLRVLLVLMDWERAWVNILEVSMLTFRYNFWNDMQKVSKGMVTRMVQRMVIRKVE